MDYCEHRFECRDCGIAYADIQKIPITKDQLKKITSELKETIEMVTGPRTMEVPRITIEDAEKKSLEVFGLNTQQILDLSHFYMMHTGKDAADGVDLSASTQAMLLAKERDTLKAKLDVARRALMAPIKLDQIVGLPMAKEWLCLINNIKKALDEIGGDE